MSLRIGADIGGTFTDIAVEDGPQHWSVKVPTSHDAPERAVLEGIAQALATAGRSLSDVSLVVHGTTLATNALIERKGARTALLTTQGFRDVLEMGNEGRFDQYDLRAMKPVPLIPRHLRFEAVERCRYDGSVVAPLDEASVVAAARAMKAEGVAAVAITFLHAYANAAHEIRAREILQAELGLNNISISAEVSPQMREYERTSTTAANAYLQPVISAYLTRLQSALTAQGLAGPLLMILSSGTLSTVETAARFPIRLLESGPAGGAIFACDVAQRLGLERVLSIDVGGTTAKFCLVDKGEVRHAHSFEVARTYRFKKGSGLPVTVPVIDLVEIGAGGGSIARVDAVGRIAVGPDSAGSEPGPACYGRGGTGATITDCDLVLGKLEAVSFAGGTMPLDAVAADTALAAHVGGLTGLTVQNAAFAVTETMSEAMASAARVHATEIGTDVGARTLIAFGGAAPLHAARFADKLGITSIVVPPGAGVGSAIGFLRAPVAFEIVRTLRAVLPGADWTATRRALIEMEEAAHVIVSTATGPGTATETRCHANMRYLGQGHEIAMDVPDDPRADAFGRDLLDRFQVLYADLYGKPIANNPVELTSWTLRVSQPAPAAPRLSEAPPTGSATSYDMRKVYVGAAGEWQDWPTYDRTALLAGQEAQGPAIVTEAETTTIVPPGFDFRIGTDGYLWLQKRAAA